MLHETFQRALRGDGEAFGEIVSEYGTAVRAFLSGHLNDPSLVDDLAQETFIVAFEKLKEFDLGSDPRAWLKGIARNHLLKHFRAAYQHGRALEKLKALIHEAVFEKVLHLSEKDDASTLDRLRHCLGKLPDRVREVVEARNLRHERVGFIAGRMGSTVVAVSSLLFRGRKLLQACMGTGR